MGEVGGRENVDFHIFVANSLFQVMFVNGCIIWTVNVKKLKVELLKSSSFGKLEILMSMLT